VHSRHIRCRSQDELVNTQLTGVQNDVQERLRFLLKPQARSGAPGRACLPSRASLQPTAASPGASNHDGVAELRKQIVAAQSVLSEGLVERETEVRLAWVSLQGDIVGRERGGVELLRKR
jgi:hypothetical protein